MKDLIISLHVEDGDTPSVIIGSHWSHKGVPYGNHIVLVGEQTDEEILAGIKLIAKHALDYGRGSWTSGGAEK